MNILKIYIPLYGIWYAKKFIQNGTINEWDFHWSFSIVYQSFIIDMIIWLIAELSYKLLY